MREAISKSRGNARAYVNKRMAQHAQKDIVELESKRTKLRRQLKTLRKLACGESAIIGISDGDKKELRGIANYLSQVEKKLVSDIQAVKSTIKHTGDSARKWLPKIPMEMGVRELNSLPVTIQADQFECSKLSRKSFVELKRASSKTSAYTELLETLAAMYRCKRSEILLYQIKEGHLFLWYEYDPVFNAFVKSLRPVTEYRYWPDAECWSIEINDDFNRVFYQHLKLYFAVALDAASGAVLHNSGGAVMSKAPARGGISLHKEDSVHVRFLGVPVSLELLPLASKVMSLLGYDADSEESSTVQLGLHIFDGEHFIRLQELFENERLSVYATSLLFELALDFGESEYILMVVHGAQRKPVVTVAGAKEYKKEVMPYLETCQIVGKPTFAAANQGDNKT